MRGSVASLPMIEAQGLTKDYGPKRAVDDLTFTVKPGVVTGFLGPNGSGKSTTMRLALGLDRPTAGDVTVNGKHYRDHAAPLHEAGALLEARSVHTGRSAYNHLLALAQTHGISRERADAPGDLAGPHHAPRSSRSAWASGSASLPRCSATRRRFSSTSRATASTRRGSTGSATCSAHWRRRDAPCSSPRT